MYNAAQLNIWPYIIPHVALKSSSVFISLLISIFKSSEFNTKIPIQAGHNMFYIDEITQYIREANQVQWTPNQNKYARHPKFTLLLFWQFLCLPFWSISMKFDTVINWYNGSEYRKMIDSKNISVSIHLHKSTVLRIINEIFEHSTNRNVHISSQISSNTHQHK